MEQIYEIIIRKNFKHVATIINRNGEIEELSDNGPVNINEVILGMAELNKNGIVLTEIQTGNSREGVTKIKNITSMGLYKNNEWIKEPVIGDRDVPEVNTIPFKTDSWVLGEFIVRTKTGKDIPRRFLKSQNLLNKFTEGDDVLRKLLVLDPEQRSFTWEVVPNQQSQESLCSIQ